MQTPILFAVAAGLVNDIITKYKQLKGEKSVRQNWKEKEKFIEFQSVNFDRLNEKPNLQSNDVDDDGDNFDGIKMTKIIPVISQME